MPDLTPERLDEIEARCEAATPGPWRNRDLLGVLGRPEDGVQICGGCTNDNRDFIAHARQDIPALIAAVRERDARIAELEKDLDWATDGNYKRHDR